MCSMRMLADDSDDIERNITSSDVDFLEGEDAEPEDVDEKTNTKTSKTKDKPESAHVSVDNLTIPDLSSLEHDVDMNNSDIMSVIR